MRNPPDNRPFKSLAESPHAAGRWNTHARVRDDLDPHAHRQRLIDARLIGGNIPPLSAAAFDGVIAAGIALGLRQPLLPLPPHGGRP